MMTNETKAARRGRGFASMDKDDLRRLASEAGKRGHELGVAHEWTRQEASAAGRIGGAKSRRRPKAKQP